MPGDLNSPPESELREASRIRFTGFAGVELAVDRFGATDGPTVLMLRPQGFGEDSWQAAAKAMAESGRNVLSLDLDPRESEPGHKRGDFDALVGDLRAILEQLPSRPLLLTASSAAWVALVAVGEAVSDFAAGLVLVDLPPRFDLPLAESNLTAGPDLPSDRVLAARRRLRNAAARVTVPTLIVASGPSEAAHAIAGAIGDAELVQIRPGRAGHAIEQREAFDGAVLQFLERRIPLLPARHVAGSDPRTLRDALGCFATGVTIVTAMGCEGRPVGLTANSFTSVSLEPPLLLVCINRSSATMAVLAEAEAFAINVLHIGQQPISTRFASRGADRFEAATWEQWSTGAPVIVDSLASFECERHSLHDGGDHIILVGRVLAVRFEPSRDPLLYFRGKYRRLHFS